MPVETDSVVARLVELGCVLDPTVRTFHKLSTPDGRKCLYLGMNNTLRRVDISGFVPSAHPAVVVLSQERARELRLGAVRGQIFPVRAPDGSDPYGALLAVVLEMLDGDAAGFKGSSRRGQDPYAQDVEAAGGEAEQDAQEAVEQEAVAA